MNKHYYGFIILRYTDAATFLLRLGLAADKCNARYSQCKVGLYILHPNYFPVLLDIHSFAIPFSLFCNSADNFFQTSMMRLIFVNFSLHPCMLLGVCSVKLLHDFINLQFSSNTHIFYTLFRIFHEPNYLSLPSCSW